MNKISLNFSARLWAFFYTVASRSQNDTFWGAFNTGAKGFTAYQFLERRIIL